MRMKRGHNQGAHDLGAGIELETAVAFPVHDEVQVVSRGKGYAALHPVRVPQNFAADCVHQVMKLRLRAAEFGEPANANLAVTPKCGGSPGSEQSERNHDNSESREQSQKIEPATEVDDRRRDH